MNRLAGCGRFLSIALQHSFTVERFSSKGSERQKPTHSGHRGDVRLDFDNHESGRIVTPELSKSLSVLRRDPSRHRLHLRSGGDREDPHPPRAQRRCRCPLVFTTVSGAAPGPLVS